MALVEVAGVDMIVKLGSGSPVAILGQRGVTLKITKDKINITTKASTGRAKKFLTGEYEWSIDFDGLVNAGAATALGSHVTTMLAGTELDITLEIGADDYTGKGSFTDLSADGPENGEATYKGTIQGSGVLTPPTYT